MTEVISARGWGATAPEPSTTQAFVRALGQLGHGVLLIEGERVVDVSDEFCRLVGRDRAGLLAMRSVFELIPPADRARLAEALRRYSGGERVPDHFAVNLMTAAGAPLPVDVAVKSVSPGSQPPRLLVIAQDMRERHGYQEDLAFQKRLLEAIAEAAIDGILVVDRAGEILYSNERFMELWRIPQDIAGSRRDELALAAIRGLLVDPDAFLARVAYLYEHPHEESREEIRLRDGRILDRYSAPVTDAHGEPRGRVWFFRDVSASRRSQEASELLAHAGELLGSSLDLEATLDQIAAIVVPRRADWAAVDVVDETGQFRRVGVAHVDPAGAEVLRELDRRWPLRMSESHLRGRAVATREPVALYRVDERQLARVARDPEQQRMLKQLGVRSALWVPMIARDRVLGVISVGYRDERRHYGPDDLELMRELARRAALAVDNALLYRAVERAERRQAAVARLGHDALSGLPLDELFRAAAEQLSRILEVPFVEVLELSADRRQLRLIAGVGWQRGVIGRAMVDAGRGSQGGYTIASTRPVVVEDMASETRFNAPALLVDHRVVSGLTAVIGDPSDPFGVLGGHSDTSRGFAVDDVNLLQAVANVLAAAVHRRRAEEQLSTVAHAEHARAAELKAVIRSIGDAVVVFDASGEVVLANPTAEALLGRRLRRGLRAILRAFVWPPGTRMDAALAAGGVELRLRGRAGRERWMELSRFPVVLGEEGNTGDGGTILVMRDVTAARDARAVRDAFLGILSHELRTPVTTIYGGSEILARSVSVVSEEARREVFADIRAEADRLYRLVENLLVLSRVEREGLAVESEPILLQRLVPRVVQAEAGRWPVTSFDVQLPPGLPPAAGEETYLELVVRNLVTNAAKYGGARVTVAAGEVEGAVRLTVSDEGPGITPGEEQRLFEIFYRSPSARQRASGAGIGLFVTQQLVRAMGGRIWAANRPTGGAEFTFELPLFAAAD